jgi:hypothetical protein
MWKAHVKDFWAWTLSNIHNFAYNRRQEKKFKHNDALDLTPCKQIRRSLVLRRRLRLISRMQRLQHLFPAKPFILWGEVPTHNAKNGDGAKDHASL